MRRIAMAVLALFSAPGFTTSGAWAATEQAGTPCGQARRGYEQALKLFRSDAMGPEKVAAADLFRSVYRDWPQAIRDAADSQVEAAVDAMAFTAALRAANSDPADPILLASIAPSHRFADLDLPDSRMGVDNPDTVYRLVPVDGNYRYRLTGHWPARPPADFNISLIADMNSQTQLAVLAKADLAADANGNFSVLLDGDAAGRAANGPPHIHLPANARALIVRDTLSDWTRELPADLTIERLDDTPAFAPLNETARAGLAALLFRDAVRQWADILKWTFRPGGLNHLRPPVLPTGNDGGILKNQMRTDLPFWLGDEDALVITMQPGDAAYASIALTNAWGVTLDPGHLASSLNLSQAVRNQDGGITAVVAVKDPGTRNWISTGGLHFGLVGLRWQGLADSAAHGSASLKQVKLADLAALLPPSLGRAGAGDRLRQTAARQASFQRRFDLCARSDGK